MARATAAAITVAAAFTVRGRSWLIDFDLRGPTRIEVWERHAGGLHRIAMKRCARFAPRWPTRVMAGRARSISWSRRRSSGASSSACSRARRACRLRAAGGRCLRRGAVAGALAMAVLAEGSFARRLRHRHAADSRRDAGAIQARDQGRPPAPRRSRHYQRAVAAAAGLGADASSRRLAVGAPRVARVADRTRRRADRWRPVRRGGSGGRWSLLLSAPADQSPGRCAWPIAHRPAAVARGAGALAP
jgi:hypothetical protein